MCAGWHCVCCFHTQRPTLLHTQQLTAHLRTYALWDKRTPQFSVQGCQGRAPLHLRVNGQRRATDRLLSTFCTHRQQNEGR